VCLPQALPVLVVIVVGSDAVLLCRLYSNNH
jgi:hypothetical protein